MAKRTTSSGALSGAALQLPLIGEPQAAEHTPAPEPDAPQAPQRPTLYLTNIASLGSKGYAGAGRHFNIQARPPFFAVGAGRVNALAPLGKLTRLMDAARYELRHTTGSEAEQAYRAAYEAHLACQRLEPSLLLFTSPNTQGAVGDGDTLTCTCARGKPCHRRWAAPYLVAAGWHVVLDGAPLDPSPAGGDNRHDRQP